MTKKYMMIGAPMTKVRTPPMLEAFMTEQGVEASVEARHVEPEDLPSFMTDVAEDRSIDGLIVTMPHKKAVLPFLAGLSKTAREVGSVNAIKRVVNGDLVGAQFDGTGLVNAVLRARIPLATATVLLAGLGGAGLSIATAIASHGCKSLTLTDLDQATVEASKSLLSANFGEGGLKTRFSDQFTYDLLINATPLGMEDGDPCPFDPALIQKARWVADIVADPPKTQLAAITQAADLTLVTGRDMVGGQVEPIGNWLLHDEVEQGLSPEN